MICKLDKNIKKNDCAYHLPDIKEIFLLNFEDFDGYDVEDCEYCVNWKEGSKWYRIDVDDDTTFADTLTIGNAGNKYRNVRLTFSLPNNGDACVEEAYNNIVLGKYVAVFKSDGVFYVCGLLDGMSVNESESSNETHTITLEENTILTTQIMSAECGQDVIDSANGQEPEPPQPEGHYLARFTFNDDGLIREYILECGESNIVTERDMEDARQAIRYGRFTAVKIGDCCKTIDEQTFANEIDLTTVMIWPGLEMIGESAFNGCIEISSIELPPTIQIIESSAFAGCNNLETITVRATTPPQLGRDVFQKGSISRPIRAIYVPSGCSSDYAMAEGWQEFQSVIVELPQE